MAEIQVRFLDGCVETVDVDKTTSPRCAHGTRAAGVVKAPAPTFRGLVRGPSAVPMNLPAIDVRDRMRTPAGDDAA